MPREPLIVDFRGVILAPLETSSKQHDSEGESEGRDQAQMGHPAEISRSYPDAIEIPTY